MAQLDWFIRANLKPRHLQLLVAMDDFRSLGRVADNVNVTQPAISKTLGELEKGLGFKLFERTSRGIQPTIYGECLIRHARTVLSNLNVARDELRELVSGSKGSTSIGALPAAMPALLPTSLALLKQRSPFTSVLVRESTMDFLLPELRQGSLDLLVGTLPQNRNTTDLSEKILSEDPVVLVSGTHHPLTQRKRLHWADLKDFPWVLPPLGSLKREPLEAALERHGVPMPQNRIETASVHMIRIYLQLTDSLAVLAGGVAKHYRSLGLLSILPLELPKMLRPVGMMWSRHRPMSPSTRLMMQCLEEATHSDLLLQAERAPAEESRVLPFKAKPKSKAAEAA
jgi:DNA-binding transcriptional LysR family regulator